ncbi:MAG: hydrogenase iron-sulfur subunit [Candidatus Marinimicrobia bacterium]|nr:hydrogenase iron-sulfur subunit [Candidatus Neomarinimicrobiota bacterium]
MKENELPTIIGFLCKWCSYAGADLAGVSRLKMPASLIPIRVMCSSRVNPVFVLKAFLGGADGVLVSGCHPGDCHYQTGNYKTRRRVILLKKNLEQMGINPDRLRLEWISASEGRKFANTMTEFTEKIRSLGPFQGFEEKEK